MAVKIVKEVLEQQVENGWKKKALAEHYGISVAQMGMALKQCGLRIKSTRTPGFEIISESDLKSKEAEKQQEEDLFEKSDEQNSATGFINTEKYDNLGVAIGHSMNKDMF